MKQTRFANRAFEWHKPFEADLNAQHILLQPRVSIQEQARSSMSLAACLIRLVSMQSNNTVWTNCNEETVLSNALCFRGWPGGCLLVRISFAYTEESPETSIARIPPVYMIPRKSLQSGSTFAIKHSKGTACSL